MEEKRKTVKYTLLHSNDMHGDFLAEKLDKDLVGGIARVSGYIKKVRQEEEEGHVIYCFSGDMFQGSMIDGEYFGLSTIKLMNYLEPFAACIGNHEIDYGISHSLLIEKCADFPVINANIYLKDFNKRLYNPYVIKDISGVKALIIGLTTPEIVANAKTDVRIGQLIEVRDSKEEIQKIIDEVGEENYTYIILLTHIGIENDRKLAASLDPEMRVGIIIGGHSHTIMEKPELINDIFIVHAGTGTKQIGRFDFYYDEETLDLVDAKWQLIDINEKNCPLDYELNDLVENFRKKIDEKYNKVLCRVDREIENASKIRQTEVGTLFSDILCKLYGLDLMFFQSGSFRKSSFDKEITYGDYKRMYPFESSVYELEVTGKTLKELISNFMTINNIDDEKDGTFLQVSSGLEVVYSLKNKEFKKISYLGKKINDDDILSLGVNNYLFNNFEEKFGIKIEKANLNDDSQMPCLSIQDAIKSYLEKESSIKAPEKSHFIVER